MLTLPLKAIPGDLKPTAAYGAAILHALARDEARGRRPPRLTHDDELSAEELAARHGGAVPEEEPPSGEDAPRRRRLEG